MVWDGRNGYTEVEAKGRRRCGRWFVVRGHDPDPAPSEGRILLGGIALGLLGVAVLIALMFAL